MEDKQLQKPEKPNTGWHVKMTIRIGDSDIEAKGMCQIQLAPEEQTKRRIHHGPQGDFVFSTKEEELEWINEAWKTMQKPIKK